MQQAAIDISGSEGAWDTQTEWHGGCRLVTGSLRCSGAGGYWYIYIRCHQPGPGTSTHFRDDFPSSISKWPAKFEEQRVYRQTKNLSSLEFRSSFHLTAKLQVWKEKLRQLGCEVEGCCQTTMLLTYEESDTVRVFRVLWGWTSLNI